jgi:hypothetical protein
MKTPQVEAKAGMTPLGILKRQIAFTEAAGADMTATQAAWLNAVSTDEKTVAERKWQSGLKPTQPQISCDVGLFSLSIDQLDMVDMFLDPTNEE